MDLIIVHNAGYLLIEEVGALGGTRFALQSS